MESDLLRGYLEVADVGSFTAASERLPVSQSGLSQQVRRLERLLGMPLFDRTTTSVELTETGRLLLPIARQIVDAENDLFAKAKALHSSSSSEPELSIYVVENGTGPLLMQMIERLRTTLPELRVEVVQVGDYDTEAVLSGVDRAAVIYRSIPGASIPGQTITSLRSEPLVVVATTSFGLGEEVATDELTAVPLRHMGWLPASWLDWFPAFAGTAEGVGTTMVVASFRDAVRSVSIDQQACVVPRSIAAPLVEEDCTMSAIIDAPELELCIATPSIASAGEDTVITEIHVAATSLSAEIDATSECRRDPGRRTLAR